MPTIRSNLRMLHSVLTRDAFYSLSLSSILAISILIARGYLSHTWPYSFLVWNLVLAWIPYLISLGLAVNYQSKRVRIAQLVVPGLIWLITFPNAPYLLTELVQLREIAPVAWVWYDLGLLGAFAFTGCYLTVASLHTMRILVKAACGRMVSWGFTLLTLLLTGLGVYLGRFLRWNSWDIILNPRGLIDDIVVRVADPLSHLQTFGFTIIFAALLFVCYVTFTRGRQTRRSASV